MILAAVTMAHVVRSLYALRSFDGVELSPQGGSVVWTERFHPGSEPERAPLRSSIYVGSPGTTAPVRVTAGPATGSYDESDAAWSPDGRRIAFLSDARSKDREQLFVADADGTHVRQLGRLQGEVQRVAWSPAGTAIAVLYIEGAHRKAELLQPARATSARSAPWLTNSA